jgi:hypothetical protein
MPKEEAQEAEDAFAEKTLLSTKLLPDSRTPNGQKIIMRSKINLGRVKI